MGCVHTNDKYGGESSITAFASVLVMQTSCTPHGSGSPSSSSGRGDGEGEDCARECTTTQPK